MRALVVAAALCAGAQAGELERALALVPARSSAAEQTKLALELTAALKRCPRGQLAVERRRVAHAWIAVRARFPEDRTRAAEAAFRAAELLRTGGDEAGAVRELEFVRALPAAQPLRARAGLELAHIERRGRRFERALDLYLSVSAEPDAPARRRDEAALWVGKTYALLGRFSDAQRWLRRGAERAVHALDRIRAWDEWCVLYLFQGDIEAAAGVLARCRVSLAEVSEEQTRLGEAVRDALERMRCIALLERAVERRRRGEVLQRSDAREL